MKLRVEMPALEPRAESARISHVRAVIGLVLEVQRDEALAAVVRGVERAGGRVATLRASLRQGSGFVVESGAVYTHVECVREALAAAIESLEAHDVLVVEGPLALDALRATVSIAVVPNHNPVALSRDLRTVRHRVDLWLLEARPRLLELVAARVLAGMPHPVIASPG